jgi:hypothetical protein
MQRMRSNLHDTMNALLVIEPRDLELLLATEPSELLGRIMRMNRTPRYHNSLNAVEVAQQVIELRWQSCHKGTSAA